MADPYDLSLTYLGRQPREHEVRSNRPMSAEEVAAARHEARMAGMPASNAPDPLGALAGVPQRVFDSARYLMRGPARPGVQMTPQAQSEMHRRQALADQAHFARAGAQMAAIPAAQLETAIATRAPRQGMMTGDVGTAQSNRQLQAGDAARRGMGRPDPAKRPESVLSPKHKQALAFSRALGFEPPEDAPDYYAEASRKVLEKMSRRMSLVQLMRAAEKPKTAAQFQEMLRQELSKQLEGRRPVYNDAVANGGGPPGDPGP